LLTDTEGIVLRQVKTSYGRRIILLFTRKYGKISAGTNIGERGKSKSSLALRPFTYGRYELFKNRENYNINTAEALKSYYKIGENVDKYMSGAYVLEFTEKILSEEVPAPGVFFLLNEFFEMLEKREKGIGTLVLAYQANVLKYMGVMPELDRCVICGAESKAAKFSVEEGGIICSNCAQIIENSQPHKLIYDVEFGIVDILRFFTSNPLKNLENLALKEDAGKLLQKIIREYAAYHLDASDLKSEGLVDNK